MRSPERPRVAYVLKMYPRLAETFILNEIMAHEAAGLDLEIFSLRSPIDGRFHRNLSLVQTPVTYIPGQSVKAEDFWASLNRARAEYPGAADIVEYAAGETAADINQAIHLAGEIRARGVTHLHAHFATIATSVARLASRMTGVPFSFTAHAKDIYHESVVADDLRRKLRDACAVVTVSDYNAAYLRDGFGSDADVVQRIYNGLDLSEFPFEAPTERPPLIVGVGRLVDKKGFADLIDACDILIKKGRNFRCEILGDGVLRERLENQVAERGVSSHVTMLGACSREEVVERVRAAALLAAPCVVSPNGNRDGLPTVLLEAMALGTPCVSTDVTGIPELVRDGDTGLLAVQHEPESLADRMEELLDDEALRVRLATNARRLIETDFDIKRNLPTLRQIFQAGEGAPDAAGGGVMRIAYVCADRGVPIFGHKGSSTHVQEVTRSLLASGHDVSLFARRVGGECPPGLEGMSVRRIKAHAAGDDVVIKERAELECNESFRERLQASGPFDLVYERHSLWSYAGMEHARAIGVPGLLEVNAPLLDEQRRYRGLALEAETREAVSRAYGAADALLAVSDGVADHLRGLGVPPERIHVVPNGVDPARFRTPLAPTLPGGPGSFTVGFVGTLRPWHGVPLLVEAFAELHESEPRSRLVILGDGPARSELEADASRRGVGDAVVFCGAVAPAAVPGILASMDVAVAPYPALEGFYFSPLKLFEYMAAERAIVAAGIGQITELIEHEKTGLLYPPGDMAALTAALAPFS